MSLSSIESPVAIDFSPIAKALNLPQPRVEAVVKLLDEGNTVPFITRYRKDQTGGLDEEPIRAIQDRVTKQRQLVERKQTILRSIDSQGKLTPELAKAIEGAVTARRLEDLYLPYKPKKQTLATAARARGLEPLALEILAADPLAADLNARLADFVNTSNPDIVGADKQVVTPADALLGAGHILAELFSERADFRGRVRTILEKSGKITTTAVEPEVKPGTEKQPERAADKSDKAEKGAKADEASQPLFAGLTDETEEAEGATFVADAVADVETPHFDAVETPEELQASDMEEEGAHVDPAEPPVDTAAPQPAVAEIGAESTARIVDSPLPSTDESAALPSAAAAQKQPRKKEKKPKKVLTKAERRAAEMQRAFRDYFQFSESVSKLPPHRVLAINRGEKAKVLRVRIDSDTGAMERVVDELLVPAGHPHAEFLRGCGRDALHRLVLPSLERELRRELTDDAETHAVEVFAKNSAQLVAAAAGPRAPAAGPRPRLQERLQMGGARRVRQSARTRRRFHRRQRRAPGPIEGEARRSGEGAATLRHRHRQRHRLPRNGNVRRRPDLDRPGGHRNFVRDRERGRRERLLGQPARPRGVPRSRRHGARRRLHRSPTARPAQRTREDRAQ
jgi:uncharacterized protein